MEPDRDDTRRARLADAFWERHTNPKSGWSRTLLGPLFLLAVYRRDPRLVALVAVAAVVNPVAFPPPDPETESWMTRGVRAERWWLSEGRGTLGIGWPNLLNTLNLPTFGYALAAAYARRPRRAVAALVVSMLLKFGWIEAIARRYDRAREENEPGIP